MEMPEMTKREMAGKDSGRGGEDAGQEKRGLNPLPRTFCGKVFKAETLGLDFGCVGSMT